MKNRQPRKAFKVGIIDCGISNLQSVKNAFDFLSVATHIATTAEEIGAFSHLVLPGVGAFAQGMENLERRGLGEAIRRACEAGRPLLGICLGMQLLASSGEEHGHTPGLDLVPGNVRKITLTSPLSRLPHVGWNEVVQTRSSPLWSDVADQADFYFVHSYAYHNVAENHVIGVCEYGDRIVAAVQKDNVLGVQFHPEKSQKNGLRVLRNFIELC